MRPLSRLWTVALMAGLVYGLPTMAKTAAPPQSTRPTVAVMDFDFGSIENWWGGNVDVGKGIADLLVNGLVDDGSWRIIERKKIDGLLNEQDFNHSDRVDPTQKAAKLGKMIGAKFLLYGSITKFGTENSNKSVGAGAFGGGKFGVGKVGTSSGKANVAIYRARVRYVNRRSDDRRPGPRHLQAQRPAARRRGWWRWRRRRRGPELRRVGLREHDHR